MGRRGFEHSEPDDLAGEEDVDERLRLEFARAFPGGEDPVRVLEGLAPDLRRARRVHRAKQALIGAAAAILLVGGGGLALTRLADGSDQGLTVAGEPDQGPDGQSGQEPEIPLIVTGTTMTDSVDTQDLAGQAAEPADGVDSSTLPSTAPSTEAPTRSSTSAGPTTTSGSSGSTSTTLIESSCGSIAVAVSGTSVTLVESFPAGNHRADEKSDGPRKIEVSFEGGGGHCELKVEVKDGRLDIDRE